MFEAIKSGGLLMIPIIICGILAIFIIVERIRYFASIKKRDRKMMIQLEEAMDKGDYVTAEANCVLADTPCSQVIKTALANREADSESLKEIVQTKMDTVIPHFEHFLTALGTISSISTMLGLLGTVTGNIKAFGVLAGGASMGDPAQLANAIAEALVTTVAGLIVAIPSIVFHNYFNSQVNHRIRDMESDVTQIMFRLTGKNK